MKKEDLPEESRFTAEFLQRGQLLFQQATNEVQQYVAMNSKMIGLQMIAGQGRRSS